jgi:uncharacterized membrane protein
MLFARPVAHRMTHPSTSPTPPPSGHEQADGTAAAQSSDPAARHQERRSRVIGTKRAFRAIKAEHSAELRPLERVANTLTRWASSTPFLILHVIWFGTWIGYNSLYVGQMIFGFDPFDPFPFGLLTMVVSLEAIFLSIFVLLSQSRESAIAELREELNLQVNLRIEEEVTKTLQLVAGLYTRLGHHIAEDPELREMLQPLDAKAIEKQLIEQMRNAAAGMGGGAAPTPGSVRAADSPPR